MSSKIVLFFFLTLPALSSWAVLPALHDALTGGKGNADWRSARFAEWNGQIIDIRTKRIKSLVKLNSEIGRQNAILDRSNMAVKFVGTLAQATRIAGKCFEDLKKNANDAKLTECLRLVSSSKLAAGRILRRVRAEDSSFDDLSSNIALIESRLGVLKEQIRAFKRKMSIQRFKKERNARWKKAANTQFCKFYDQSARNSAALIHFDFLSHILLGDLFGAKSEISQMVKKINQVEMASKLCSTEGSELIDLLKKKLKKMTQTYRAVDRAKKVSRMCSRISVHVGSDVKMSCEKKVVSDHFFFVLHKILKRGSDAP